MNLKHYETNISKKNFMQNNNKKTTDLERIETRIGLLRDESRHVSYRIEHMLERRKQINTEIQNLKELAKEIKG